MLTTLTATGSWCTFLLDMSSEGSPTSLLQYFVVFLGIVFLIALFRRFKDGREAIGHWHHHFTDLQMSSKEFYEQIEDIIKGMKEPHIKTKYIIYSEGGFISSDRQYLRVSRGDILFDICAAPFGTGFFISWWQADKDFFKRFWLAFPLLGRLFERAFYPHTYYHVDTQQMFQATIHEILLSSIDALIIDKGLRGLTDLEKVPTRGKLQTRAVTL